MPVQFIIIGILTAINAFFASAEMAMVSLNKNKLRTKVESLEKKSDTSTGNSKSVSKDLDKAKLLLKLLDEPSKFLATIQVGITFAGFFSSAFAATGLSVGLGQTFKSMGIPYGEQMALILVTIALSFIMLLFGELFPKRLALQKAEPIAMFSVKPIYYISIVTKPFVKLLSVCTNGLIRLVGMNQKGLDQKVSEEEIRSMVKVGQELGVFNQTEKQMINSIFEFDDKLVQEVMTPRIDVKMVDINAPLDDLLTFVATSTFSRVPVYEDDKNNIIGVLHIKNLLKEAKEKGFENLDIKTLLQSPYYVPETMVIDHLFIQLQKERQHMAQVVDEHGLVTGVVTMEDLIEEVMGDIDDEFDEVKNAITYGDDGSYHVDGGMALFDFNSAFHTNLKSHKSDTIGGYIIEKLGKIPKDGEENLIKQQGLTIAVESVYQQRITLVKVKKNH